MKKLFFYLYLFMCSLITNAQSWDKFKYETNTEKYFYDVDESSFRFNNDVITGWIRLREKTPNNNSSFALLDLMHFHCKTYQYALSTRRNVDKNGKLIKVDFDIELNNLKWSDTIENSIGRSMGVKYCKNTPNSNVATSTDNWISLGRDEKAEFTYYIDPSKNKKINEELIYISKIDLASPKSLAANKSYDSMIQENIVNCRDSTYAVVRTEYLNSSGIVVDKSVLSKEFSTFNSMSPSSFVGRVSKRYCDDIYLNANQKNNNQSNNLINRTISGNKDSEFASKCELLGFKKGTSPFERCFKQLIEMQ